MGSQPMPALVEMLMPRTLIWSAASLVYCLVAKSARAPYCIHVVRLVDMPRHSDMQRFAGAIDSILHGIKYR